MEYSLIDEGNVKRVAFYGNIKASSRPKILEIAQAMSNENQKDWVLDVHEFEYIDSSGLGMMIELHDEASKHDIKLSVSGANNLVKKMFKLSRFDTMFTLVE